MAEVVDNFAVSYDVCTVVRLSLYVSNNAVVLLISCVISTILASLSFFCSIESLIVIKELTLLCKLAISMFLFETEFSSSAMVAVNVLVFCLSDSICAFSVLISLNFVAEINPENISVLESVTIPSTPKLYRIEVAVLSFTVQANTRMPAA